MWGFAPTVIQKRRPDGYLSCSYDTSFLKMEDNGQQSSEIMVQRLSVSSGETVTWMKGKSER